MVKIESDKTRSESNNLQNRAEERGLRKSSSEKNENLSRERQDVFDKRLVNAENIINQEQVNVPSGLYCPHGKVNYGFHRSQIGGGKVNDVDFSIIHAKELAKSKKMEKWEQMEKEGRGEEAREEMRHTYFAQ